MNRRPAAAIAAIVVCDAALSHNGPFIRTLGRHHHHLQNPRTRQPSLRQSEMGLARGQYTKLPWAFLPCTVSNSVARNTCPSKIAN